MQSRTFPWRGILGLALACCCAVSFADEPQGPTAEPTEARVEAQPTLVVPTETGPALGNASETPAAAETTSEKEPSPAESPSTKGENSSGIPDASLPPLSRELIDLRGRLRKTLAQYYPQHLVAPQRSCWEVMHGVIAYGVDSKLFRTSPRGDTVNAVGWMCYNQPCHGEQLFYLDRGKLVARRGPGLQGHTGQFLAIIAQSHVPANFPMKIGGKAFTVQDLIDYEKADCRSGEELTFKLIGLSHYLESNAEWTTKDGQKWNIPRLIKEELKQPILRVAACGGTHRLMGHSYAIYKRRKQELPINGQFARAEKFIADYHRYTYSLQNPDGSFSTKWFEGRESKPDIDRKLKTTGHIFEWMSFSVPEQELRSAKMVKAANFLVNTLQKNIGRDWEVGPHSHALHSLRIYDRRLFKPYDHPNKAESVLQPTTADAGAKEPVAEPKTALKTALKPDAAETAEPTPEKSTTQDEAPVKSTPQESTSVDNALPNVPATEASPSTTTDDSATEESGPVLVLP